MYCPLCWARSKCIDSRCHERSNTVRRRHVCTHEDCNHRFTTVELIVGSVDLRAAQDAKLLELAWEIFDKLGGDKADDMFIEAWESRKKNKQDASTTAAHKMMKKPSNAHPWRRSYSFIPKVAQ